MNKVTLIGNLTNDIELKKVSDKSVAVLNVAVARRYAKDKTDFISVEAWGATADNCAKYLGKGSKVAVSGELHIDTYEKDGAKKQLVKVVADEVEFIGKKHTAEELKAETKVEATPISDADMPF